MRRSCTRWRCLMTSSRSWGFLAYGDVNGQKMLMWPFNMRDFITKSCDQWINGWLKSGNLWAMEIRCWFPSNMVVSFHMFLSETMTRFPLKPTQQKTHLSLFLFNVNKDGISRVPLDGHQIAPKRSPWPSSYHGMFSRYFSHLFPKGVQTKPIWGIYLDRNVYFSHLFPKAWYLRVTTQSKYRRIAIVTAPSLVTYMPKGCANIWNHVTHRFGRKNAYVCSCRPPFHLILSPFSWLQGGFVCCIKWITKRISKLYFNKTKKLTMCLIRVPCFSWSNHV